jgi:uncharacterized membrane protein
MRWPEIIIMLIVAMLTVGSAFWIWMLLDCALNKGLKDRAKIIWMLCILFTHWVGALIYFFTGRLLRYQLNQVEK